MNLEYLGEDLEIFENPNLVSLTPNPGFQTMLGTVTDVDDLKVQYNPSLTNLLGLESLTKLRGALQVYKNQNLVSLRGLENVVSIGVESPCDTYIQYCPIQVRDYSARVLRSTLFSWWPDIFFYSF